MDKRKREALGTGIFIMAVLFGDIFGGYTFKWIWIIGIGVLFLFFAIVPDNNSPIRFIERD